MKQFKFWNALLGWIVFAIAAATYLLTMEPTASFWDCGEFISSAYKLDVGHPCGAPFFMLMGKFFSLFASDPSHVAMCVNALSALASAFTILFLFWTITALAKKLVTPDTTAKVIGILGAGAVGALAYTFSDTFWFSAVEGEVYASSSLFTAAVFWLILKWDEHADEDGSDRWLILIAYLMGLSIGVHLLNLLTIPAIVLVYYFNRFKFTWKGAIVAFLCSCGMLAVVLYGMIPGFVLVAGWFELLFTNALHMPYNTGLAIYIVLLLVALAWSIYESYKQNNRTRMYISFILSVFLLGIPFFGENILLGIILLVALTIILFTLKDKVPARILNTATIMLTVILIGYSSYATLVIRSNADTPMDQNSPDNVFSLKYYLNREQYGDRPLLYGPVYSAPVLLEVEGDHCVPVESKGKAQYAPAPEGEDHYVVTGYKTHYEMNPQFKMLFPRVYSAEPRHVQAYKDWAEIKGVKVRYDYCGQRKVETKPTFAENLKFFFRYQCNYMYWRYFMWNFSGRQNDLQGYGEIHKGNWITGISFLDNARLGNQKNLPTELRENKGHNVYYMLPLLLGIIGIIYQLGKKEKGLQNFTLVALLFLLTGLAIVVYLNQTPYQPRERDYAYAGSFYAFSIWIGLGVLALVDKLTSKIENNAAKLAIATLLVVLTLGVPALMAQQNWDDHDRSGRYSCRDFGANYLKSCEPNAIIFCNGDNDTFPLWYNQEVEGVRTDIRCCNLSYVQTDWYIDQMKRPYYESEGLPISWEKKDYISGKNEVVWVENKIAQPMSVKQAFEFIRSDEKYTKRNGENYLPTDQLYIPVNPAEVQESGLFTQYTPEQYASKLELSVNRRLTKSEMMVLEMISSGHWKRPIYFACTVGGDYYLGLDKYMECTGLALQVTPVAGMSERVNTEKMYDNMMNKFCYGGLNKPHIYVDENLSRMVRTHRMMFQRLADELIRENQKDKALEVLDKCEEVFPASTLAYDYTSALMAQNYYQIGETEHANAILESVANTSVEYLVWISTLKRENQKALLSTSSHHVAVLGTCLQLMERYGQEELTEQYYPYYMEFARR